jgi:hypothetical protein
MKIIHLALATALALGTLAGCDRTPNERAKAAPPSTSSAGTGGTTGASTTPTTPANAGTPSEAEKKTGSNPVQGQVDPKQREQHKDFQHRGDGAGPKQPGG